MQKEAVHWEWRYLIPSNRQYSEPFGEWTKHAYGDGDPLSALRSLIARYPSKHIEAGRWSSK